MPVYLFTFHAYRSWMPDRKRGYVRRRKGILPQNHEEAERYRERAKDEQTILTKEIQRSLLEEVQTASLFQTARFHGGSTEPSHLHIIVSWKDQRAALKIRNALKQSLSRRLTKLSEATPLRLSEGASQKRVRDQRHLDHLLKKYLPKHHGVAWYADDRQWVDQFLQ